MPVDPLPRLSAVPDRPDPDVYGHIDFFDGIKTRRLTIAGYYGGPLAAHTEDILVARDGWVLRHPYDSGRESTEEERAAVGWTW